MIVPNQSLAKKKTNLEFSEFVLFLFGAPLPTQVEPKV